MPFINVPQRRTCRYEIGVTPSEIKGLFTDTFTDCVMLVLFNEKKVSLTHVDDCLLNWPSSTNPLSDELEWVGWGCKALKINRLGVIYPERNLTNLLRKYHNELVFDGILVNHDESAISIDANQFLSTYERSNNGTGIFELPKNEQGRFIYGIQLYNNHTSLPDVIRHPYDWQLLCTHVLRYSGKNSKACYSHKVPTQQVIYDGIVFSQLGNFDAFLDKQTADFYRDRMSLSPSVFQVFNNLWAKGLCMHKQVMLMSFYLQQYLHKNDYAKMRELNQNCPDELKDLYEEVSKVYKFDTLFERQAKEKTDSYQPFVKGTSSLTVQDVNNNNTGNEVTQPGFNQAINLSKSTSFFKKQDEITEDTPNFVAYYLALSANRS